MQAIKMSVMFAVIGMMLATSCSNDEFDEPFDNETPVTFSLGLENAMSTRAISDGKGVNKLIYAVFDKAGNRVAQSDDSAEFPFEKTISLVKGEQYTAVFWAQNKECNAYTISEDFTTITVNYAGAKNNDETRDAFFRSETFTVKEGVSLNVILKRPFAQVNMGVTQTDWDNAASAGFKITKSSVEIKQAATTLNLIDGTVGTPADVTFAVNTILDNDNKLIVDLNCDGESEEYKYLSMCYFLANDSVNGSSQTTLDGLKFVLSSEDGSKTLTLQDGLANAPVQRNYRTNIVGSNILTEDIDVSLTVDHFYDGEHTLSGGNVWEKHEGIYTEEALAGKTIEIPGDWYIRNGGIYQQMPENWTVDSSPLYTKPYTIDGKDHTITFEPYGYEFVTKNTFAAADGQLVTVKNITFAGEHFGIFGGVYGGVSGRANYNTLFENVKIIDNGIYCYNSAGSIPMSVFSNLGTATLNNCTIKGTYWVGSIKDQNVNAQDCYNIFGIYDIFVPNNILTAITNSTIGKIRVNNHGHLTVSGTSIIDTIDALALVKGHVTIESGAKVTSLTVGELSPSYAPTLKIMAGATVETLNLNLITNTTKITIEDGANITKIIHKGVEYSSVADFKASL